MTIPADLPEPGTSQPSPVTYTQLCELLGFNPAETSALIVTSDDQIRAISTDLIEPLTDTSEAPHGTE